MKQILLIAGAITCLTGCVIPTRYNPAPSNTTTYKEPPIENYRKGENDWGLSLSGGGIRSGAFSIGTLKALYDLGYLQNIDVVSTVSGGGYAWYWLLSQNDTNQTFGKSVFENSVWARKNSELQLSSRFAPYPSASLRVLRRPSAGAKYYEDRIVQFGHSQYRQGEGYRTQRPQEALDETIDSYQAPIAAGQIPYFIVNTTIRTPRSGSAKLVEIAPTHIGNNAFGYSLWKSNQEPPAIRTVQAMEMSGAALRHKLAQKVPDYIHGQKRMTLYDGGGGGDKGENLGAYALIRRGISNIIIVDAEADPDYGFGAYRYLTNLLQMDGISMSVSNIDRHLASSQKVFDTAAMSEGTARGVTSDGKVINSKLYYIKMCMPKDLCTITNDGDAKAFHFFGQNREQLDKRDAIIFPKRLLEPENLPKLESFGPLDQSFYGAAVAKYATFLNLEKGSWRANACNLIPGTLFNYTFPHITTFDPSFYPNELEALVGLGYLQTSVLPKQANTVSKN